MVYTVVVSATSFAALIPAGRSPLVPVVDDVVADPLRRGVELLARDPLGSLAPADFGFHFRADKLDGLYRFPNLGR